ncbi:hypothetical protein [Roseiconus lacunae]|uniref:Uncharacterized protein n=1 Tax=Roseiconus lacunae TaxID=2605694 RepID=A0ABT7PR89_9BACT|nr:hypothetical protein [Roseiconus lacunae]MDM4018833.1 hypothetical protein [Roseiconus lacunae]
MPVFHLRDAGEHALGLFLIAACFLSATRVSAQSIYVTNQVDDSGRVTPILYEASGNRFLKIEGTGLEYRLLIDGRTVESAVLPAQPSYSVNLNEVHLVEIVLANGQGLTFGTQCGNSPSDQPHLIYAASRDLFESAEAIRKLRVRPRMSVDSPGIRYPGAQPQNTPRPLTAPFTPPVGGLDQFLDPDLWIAEEPSQPRTPWYHEIPYFVRDENDNVIVASYFSKSGRTVESALESVEKSVAWDGPRNVNLVSPYATYRATPDDGSGRNHRGWIGLDLSGRLWHTFDDGTVVTIAGPRTIAGRVPDRSGGPKELVGIFHDGPFKSPVDFVLRPSHPGTAFFADTGNRRICKAERIDGETNVWEYKALGYRPFSIDMHGDEMAIADVDHHRVWINDEAITHESIQFPSVIRYDSRGNLIVGCRRSKKIVRINAEDRTVDELATLGAAGKDSWIWLDIDKLGNCLPIDTIVIQNSIHARSWTQILLPDGSLQTWKHPAFSDYAWAVAIDDRESRMIFSGFGDTSGVMQIRPRMPFDPPPHPHHVAVRQRRGWEQLRASSTGRLIGPTGSNFLGFPTRFDLETWTVEEVQLAFPKMSRDTIFALTGK